MTTIPAVVNVSIWIPNGTVASMQDEIADGSVARAVEAVRKAYTRADSDGDVPLYTYSEDFDNGVDEATTYAGKTPGRDLVVIVTDFVCDDPARVERLFAELPATDDFVVLVPVSNQGFDEVWATKLDNEGPGAKYVDVVSVDKLDNDEVAYHEVETWLNK